MPKENKEPTIIIVDYMEILRDPPLTAEQSKQVLELNEKMRTMVMESDIQFIVNGKKL